MGRAFVFGDNIDTDQIIPAQHITSADPAELAEHCFETLDASFNDRFDDGDVVVAETNFGGGSSREHAPLAIAGAGASAVVAESFSRIFFRNAINIGLPVFEIPDITDHVDEGDDLRVDLAAGEVRNTTTCETFTADSFPDFIQELLDAGGLIEYGQQLDSNDRR
jgi:3-isopropylmalate/(R)-2-methylmalate dehydratase small subunit